MFRNQITFYASMGFDWLCWLPNVQLNLGESTHFVHPDEEDEEYPDGIPLNKEWSLSFMWMNFHLNICYNKPLPYKDDDED